MKQAGPKAEISGLTLLRSMRMLYYLSLDRVQPILSKVVQGSSETWDHELYGEEDLVRFASGLGDSDPTAKQLFYV